MARGALRAKSSFKGKLDLFNQCQLSFKRSRQSTLHTLHEVQLQKHHSALSRQLSRFEQTCYASQLISQCIEEDTPVEGLFELFDAYLMGMQEAQTESCLQTLCFECHLLDLLGSSRHPPTRACLLRSGISSLIGCKTHPGVFRPVAKHWSLPYFENWLLTWVINGLRIWVAHPKTAKSGSRRDRFQDLKARSQCLIAYLNAMAQRLHGILPVGMNS